MSQVGRIAGGITFLEGVGFVAKNEGDGPQPTLRGGGGGAAGLATRFAYTSIHTLGSETVRAPHAARDTNLLINVENYPTITPSDLSRKIRVQLSRGTDRNPFLEVSYHSCVHI